MLFLCGVALSLTFGRAGRDDDTPESPNGTATPRGARPSAGAALGTFTVKDIDGRLIPIVTKGEPAIIMVSSRTCAWCRQTLDDLHAMAGGRPLPRLKLLTLEGAAEGVPMLAEHGLTGVQLLGPESGADQVFLMFRYPGTPTFLAVDSTGHVVRTQPGYPGRDALKSLFAVMVGDRAEP